MQIPQPPDLSSTAAQMELTSIFNKIKTDKKTSSIKALCSYITRNRSNTEETIKKICLFINANNDKIPICIIVRLISSLLDLLTENSQMINFLNMVLPLLEHLIYYNNRTIPELDDIVYTIGSLIKDRGIFIRQIIEPKIEELFDKFSNDLSSFKFENTKYGMIRLFSIIIYNSPTISYNKIVEKSTFEIFLKILDNFKDSKDDIRKAVGNLISNFLFMIHQRDIKIKDRFTNDIYERIYKQFVSYIKENNPPTSFSMVDGFVNALKSFEFRKDFIKRKVEQIMSVLLTCRNSKNTQIKIAFIQFMPFIASCDMKLFCEDYSHLVLPFMTELFTYKQNPELRSAILTSAGELSLKLPKNSKKYESFFPNIIEQIKICFDKEIIELPMFDSLSNIIKVYREEVTNRIDLSSVLTKMFKIGFYSPHVNFINELLNSYDYYSNEHIKILIITLNVVSKIICDQSFPINEGLKDLTTEQRKFASANKTIEHYLRENGFNPVSTLNLPLQSLTLKRNELVSDVNQKPITIKEELTSNALLFLKQVSHKYFTRDIIIFYNTYCLTFLKDKQSSKVIQEKCIELSNSNWLKIFSDDVNNSEYILSNILDAYLNVIIENTKDEVKYKMINALDSRFYFLLEKEYFFHKLISILSLNDNNIKKGVLQIIGEILKYTKNNKYIELFIQKNIINILSTIASADNIVQKEEQVLLLKYYVMNTKDIFHKGSIEMIYKTLITLIQTYANNPILNVNILTIVSELVKDETNANEEDYAYYLNIILDVCLNNLKEGLNTSKLQVSLKTIYHIFKHQKIDLYKVTTNTNFTGEDKRVTKISAPYLEFVSILLQILIRDTNNISKKYVLDIFGLCGAMDPEQLEKMYNVSHNWSSQFTSGANKNIFATNTNSLEVTGQNKQMESNEVDPCTKQAVVSLMRILKDNSQQELSTQIIACLGGLIKSLQPTDSPLIDIILPTVIEMIPQFEQSYAKSMFENLITILRNFREKFSNYISQFVQIIKIYLQKENYHDIVFQVLPKVLQEFNLENYYYIFIPIFIKLIKERSKETKNIVLCFSQMAFKLSTYLNIIVPEILLLYQTSSDEKILLNVLGFIEKIIYLENVIYYIPAIIQALLKGIKRGNQFAERSLEIFTKMNNALRNEFISYLPMIIRQYKTLSNATQFIPKLKALLTEPSIEVQLKDQMCLFKCVMSTNINPVNQSKTSAYSIREGITTFNNVNEVSQSSNTTNMKNRKTQTDKELIVKVFDTEHFTVEDDWREWLKASSKILFEQSPSYALFYCHMVADYYFPLILELYNYGFISVWRNFNDYHKMSVINNLTAALTHPTTPNDILLTIINLAEFFQREEHDTRFIEFAKLGNIALKCKAYAKALYYKECDFRNFSDLNTFEELISLYYELKLPESAIGILKQAKKNKDNSSTIHEDNWYIKLHQWKEGLKTVNSKLQDTPDDPELIKMKIQCLDGLGDWEELLAMTPLPVNDNETSLILTKASLNLSQWDDLKKYNSHLKDVNDDIKYQKDFYDAIISINDAKYKEALEYVGLAKEEVDKKIKSLLCESYARGYELLLKNELLCQLEEIIKYKQNKIQKNDLINLWNTRLQYINKDPSIFERALSVRSIVLNMDEDYENYLTLAKICRKENRFDTSYKVLSRIKRKIEKMNKTEKTNEILIKIELNTNKCLFEEGNEKSAIDNSKKIITEYSLDDVSDKIKSKVYGSFAIFSIHNLDIAKANSEDKLKSILQYLELSTKYNHKNYKSWHCYALLNYQFFEHLSQSSQQNCSPTAITYAINAVTGFTNSICIGGRNISKILQDLLRLLDLWFRTGSLSTMPSVIQKSFSSIDIDSFLLVIPQLLARIDIRDKIINTAMHELLLKIGNTHPRALIYPLIVMHKSRSKTRKNAAGNILQQMKQEHSQLAKECEMFVDEFNRCALLLHEEWYESIEEGAKLYFTVNDINGMIKILLQAHEKMHKPPETMNEVHFHQLFAAELSDAEYNLKTYLETGNEMELKQAWDIYHSVYSTIGKHYNNFRVLHLENVSPKLYNLRQSQICVPGLYQSGGNIADDKHLIRISHIDQTLFVFSTKQHPRKVSIYGTNDKEYMFLLKGHEDLRQDERAMQLFNLVNALLANERSTAHKNLFIKCFSVLPLSHNTGIIGWVPNCDTLHQLIKEFRTNNKIVPNCENRFMYQLYPRFESSTFLNKVEVFKNVLQWTRGEELYKILWSKSKNSEAWLERRTNYSRSLAVMSMVGYILGLGDRHPSNLMLDRRSGKIIHIDFGDCFEVAMKRDKFPERVPFRLTRMLIKALEVSGIEGTFRITCETVMKILRENKDSLLAILASFVHDPLISFRLMIPMIVKKNRNTLNEKNSSKILNNKEGIKERTNEIVEQSEKFEGTEQNEIGDDNYAKKMQHRDEIQLFNLFEERDEIESEELNKIAKLVLDRIEDKLQGTDFKKEYTLDVKNQVEKLICQATSHENLAQSYMGWCPFW